MTIVVDENLAPDFAPLFSGRGHEVFVVSKTTDELAIAADANRLGAIVVTSDRDFLRLITRNPFRDTRRYPRAGLIVLSGDDNVALARLEQPIDLIEFLYALLQRDADPRLIMHIRERTIWIDW